MCENCKQIDTLIKPVMDIIKNMHEAQGVNPSPSSVGQALDIIFAKVAAEVMAQFATDVIGKIAESLGLPKDASKDQIAEELIKQAENGSLPPGLEVAVLSAKELVNSMSQSKDDDDGAPSPDMLN